MSSSLWHPDETVLHNAQARNKYVKSCLTHKSALFKSYWGVAHNLRITSELNFSQICKHQPNYNVIYLHEAVLIRLCQNYYVAEWQNSIWKSFHKPAVISSWPEFSGEDNEQIYIFLIIIDNLFDKQCCNMIQTI